MHENDAAVRNLGFYRADNFIRILVLPVQSIYRPEDKRHRNAAFHRIGNDSARKTCKYRSYTGNLLYLCIGLCKFLHDIVRRIL